MKSEAESRHRPWWFGPSFGLPEQWVHMPTPVGALCVKGCGQRIEDGDSGVYLWSPVTGERHPIHRHCLIDYLHDAHVS